MANPKQQRPAFRLFVVAGRQNAGKTTAAAELERAVAAVPGRVAVRREMSDGLKDAVAAAFGFDRARLRNETAEDRAYTERADPFWAAALDRPGFGPRQAMQVMGKALRDSAGTAVWTAGVAAWAEAAVRDGATDVIVSGVRYRDEAATLLRFAAQAGATFAVVLGVERPALGPLDPRTAPECEAEAERLVRDAELCTERVENVEDGGEQLRAACRRLHERTLAP